jgi:class 3 adenylate cyclase
MFCDLVGSTALASALDPEEYRTILKPIMEVCAETVAEFGASWRSTWAMAWLAYFGYPQAHEDDAGRAVRAAWL